MTIVTRQNLQIGTAFVLAWALSAAVVLPVLQPDVLTQYLRALLFALAAAIVAFILLAAALFHYRVRAMPSGVRPRYVKLAPAWGMGASYAISLVQNCILIRTFLWNSDFTAYGAPLLLVNEVLAIWWLVSLVRHERRMLGVEARSYRS